MSKQTSPFIALRHRNFRYYWIAFFISSIGIQMQTIAIGWHMYELTGSAVSLGLLGLAGFLPIIIFSLLGGVISDKLNRKYIVVITRILYATVALLLVVSYYLHFISPLVIYIVVALNSFISIFDIPAAQSAVPGLLPREHFMNGVSINTLMNQVAIIVGPSIGGLLIEVAGVQSVYLVNILFYIISALLMARVHVKHSAEHIIPVSVGSIVEGLSFVKKNKIIFSSMVLDFFATFFSSAKVLLPIFAKDILQVGPKGLGLLYASASIGGVLGGIIISTQILIRNQGKILLSSVAFYGLATIGFGLSRWMPVSMFFLALLGFSDMISTVIRNTLRQLLTPDYLRGRMVSINMIFFRGGPLLGDFEAGVIAALFSAPFSVVTGGIGTITVVFCIAVVAKKLRNYQGAEIAI